MEGKKLIDNAINDLFTKLNNLDIQHLNISENSRHALLKYEDDFSYLMCAYSQLLQKALRKIMIPASESIFIDYGGGCGLLSFLAKLTGFKAVIYIDINEQSLNDVKVISEKLNISVDHYICGDVEEFVNHIKRLNIKPDLICSFDVLEHIYNLESWIRTITEIQKFSLFFMTGANSRNPVIVNRLKKLHKKSEYQGFENNIRFNDIYLNTSSLRERENIIRNKFTELSNKEVEFLSKNSRGLRIDDIEKMVLRYIKEGSTKNKIDHPTNTCDPYTGSWTERLIDLKQLKAFIESHNLSVNITNSFYCYSDNNLANIIKFFLNQLIKISGRRSLFLSPTITLEIQNGL